MFVNGGCCLINRVQTFSHLFTGSRINKRFVSTVQYSTILVEPGSEEINAEM